MEEHAACLSVPALSGLVESCRAVVLPEVGVGKMVQEKPRRGHVPILAGDHQLCAAVRRATILIRVYLRFDDQTCTIQVEGTAKLTVEGESCVESGAHSIVSIIDTNSRVCARLQQYLHTLGGATLGGNQEQREARLG